MITNIYPPTCWAYTPSRCCCRFALLKKLLIRIHILCKGLPPHYLKSSCELRVRARISVIIRNRIYLRGAVFAVVLLLYLRLFYHRTAVVSTCFFFVCVVAAAEVALRITSLPVRRRNIKSMLVNFCCEL